MSGIFNSLILLFSISFYGPFPLIFTFGAIQGLILSTLLWVRKENKISNRLMALFIAAFSLPTLNFALFNSSFGIYLGPRILMEPFTFLFGPAFYLYIKYQFEKKELQAAEALHFLPFVFFMFWEIAFFGNLISSHFRYEELSAVSAVIYSFLSYHVYRRNNARNRSMDHDQDHRRMPAKIILYCYLAYVIFCISFLVILFLQVSDKMVLINFVGLFITVCIYSIGYLSFWKGQPMDSQKKIQDKYACSVLSEEMVEKIKAGVLELVSAKIYLKANLKVEDIARELNTSPRYVSQVINDQFSVSFPDFINDQRVREAKRIIVESEDNPKLLSVALDSGFSNKVSFINSFKKKTGLTPKQFKEQVSK